MNKAQANAHLQRLERQALDATNAALVWEKEAATYQQVARKIGEENVALVSRIKEMQAEHSESVLNASRVMNGMFETVGQLRESLREARRPWWRRWWKRVIHGAARTHGGGVAAGPPRC
jgi:hypothetical protein